MNCRYCHKPDATIKTIAYWSQTPDVCHAECKQSGEREEAFDCQVIDADCNDCAHFKRGWVVRRWLSAIINKKPDVVLTNMGVVTGICLKFNKPCEAHPHQSTGMKCFEHRRSITTHPKPDDTHQPVCI